MEKSSLPLPQKRDLIYANSARLEKRSSIQLKHCLRDSAAGKTGPLRVQAERSQITSGYLRRRFVHTAKKAAVAGSPVTLKGTKVAAIGSLYSTGVCVVPVTPETSNEGGESRSKSGSASMIKSKLLQLQERNRMIMARHQSRVIVPDVMLTSPLTVEIDAGDVMTDKSADSQRRPSSDLSTVSPIYHELDPLDSCYNISAAATDQQHTYQSISEVREEIARLEAQRDSAWKDSAREANAIPRPENALVLLEQTPSGNSNQSVLQLTRVGSDLDAAKQTRSKSRSIFSKFWQSKRTPRPPPPDENPAARPLRASGSSRGGEALSPSTEDALLCRQLSLWEPNFATYQPASPLVIRNSAMTSDSRNNNLNSFVSSAGDGLVVAYEESDYQNLPFSLRDQFYLSKTCDVPETGIEDRMRSVFANQNSALYLRTFARHRQDTRASRKYDDHPSDYDGWTNQGCRLTRVSHTDKISGHEYENYAERDDVQPGCFFNSMYDNLQLVRMTSYDDHEMETSPKLPNVWQSPEVCMDDSSSVYFTNIPTVSMSCLGKLAPQLRFSSPCCGVRMAEMRAVWRKSKRVFGSDSTAQNSLLPLRSVTDSNWGLQHKRGSRYRESSPPYTQVQTRQNRTRIVEESEEDCNSQVLSLISNQELDNRECFGCDTSQSPTPGSEENSTNETDWSVGESKHSVEANRKCVSPDKIEENLDENDDSDLKQGLATKENESGLKQPKPVRATQSKTSSIINSRSVTKLNMLQSGQQSKENTDHAGDLDCKTTALLLNNRRTTEVQQRRQVKHAFVRHIRTVVGEHATQNTSEMLRARSGSNIPRTKTKLKHHPTKDTQSTDCKESCEKTCAKDVCKNESVSNSQDQTATNDRHISDIVSESEIGLEKELLLEAEPLEPSQLLTTSADISGPATSEKTKIDEDLNSDSCGSLRSGKTQSNASSSLSPSLTSSQSSGSVVADSESESLSLSLSREFETTTTSTTTTNSTSDSHPTSPVAEQNHSTNEDVEPSENKRRRGGRSHLVAPRTDAAKCLQRIELLRVEAKQRKHEICQTLRL